LVRDNIEALNSISVQFNSNGSNHINCSIVNESNTISNDIELMQANEKEIRN